MWCKERIGFDLLHCLRDRFLSERTADLFEGIESFVASILDEIDVGKTTLHLSSAGERP